MRDIGHRPSSAARALLQRDNHYSVAAAAQKSPANLKGAVIPYDDAVLGTDVPSKALPALAVRLPAEEDSTIVRLTLRDFKALKGTDEGRTFARTTWLHWIHDADGPQKQAYLADLAHRLDASSFEERCEAILAKQRRREQRLHDEENDRLARLNRPFVLPRVVPATCSWRPQPRSPPSPHQRARIDAQPLAVAADKADGGVSSPLTVAPYDSDSDDVEDLEE